MDDYKALETCLEVLKSQLRVVEDDVSRLKAADLRHAAGLDEVRAKLTSEIFTLRAQVADLRGKIDSLQAGQERVESVVTPMRSDVADLKAAVTKAATVVALVDLAWKLLLAKLSS